MFEVKPRHSRNDADQVVLVNVSVDTDGDVWVSSGMNCDIFLDPKDALKFVKKHLKRSIKHARKIQSQKKGN